MARPKRTFMEVEDRAAREARAEAIREKAREERRILREQAKETALAMQPVPELEALVSLHGDKAYTKKLRKRSSAYMAEHLPEYAQLHLRATKIAADKGDARPAEWALQHVRIEGEAPVVEPPAKVAQESGIKILIGVNLGGLGPVEVVSASNEEKANEGVQAPRGRLPDPRVVEGTLVGGPGR